MKKLMQGDVEALLRAASEVIPLPILADDPRLAAFGPQFATMLLRQKPHREEHGNG